MERARQYLQPQFVLLGLILVAGAGAIYLYQERGGLKEELSQLESNIPVLEDDLAALGPEKVKVGEELAARTEELELKQQETQAYEDRVLGTEGFPTHKEAKDIGGRILSYVGDQGLVLDNFDGASGTAPVGDREFPVLTYTIVARGDAGPMVGMFSLLKDVTPSRIQKLELVRENDELETWTMTLELVVFHAPEG